MVHKSEEQQQGALGENRSVRLPLHSELSDQFSYNTELHNMTLGNFSI